MPGELFLFFESQGPQHVMLPPGMIATLNQEMPDGTTNAVVIGTYESDEATDIFIHKGLQKRLRPGEAAAQTSRYLNPHDAIVTMRDGDEYILDTHTEVGFNAPYAPALIIARHVLDLSIN